MVDNKKTFFSVAQFTNESEPIVAHEYMCRELNNGLVNC